MKLFLSCLMVLAVAGCSTNLTNNSFDSIEASRYADIAYMSNAMIPDCARQDRMVVQVMLLNQEAERAANYSALKVKNDRIAKAGAEVKSLTSEMEKRYSSTTPSEGYCKLKLSQINLTAEAVARSIGKKEE